MDIREILGQLFILGFQGTSLPQSGPIIEDLTNGNLGGVILFDRLLARNSSTNNIESARQVKQLCSSLQSKAQTPLLITIDQEGGSVCRLKTHHGFPSLPSAESLAKEGGISASAQHAAHTAKLLVSLGITLNFAPVADLNTNPLNPVIGSLGRSFSADPDIVADHCEIWLDEMQKAGGLGCMKHFPGHGSSSRDSHKDFVDISTTWKMAELIPYRKMIETDKVHVIMLGHLFHNSFDTEHPASLSTPIIQELLRKDLGFSGLVVTDDMQMKAITRRYGLFDSIVMALDSGVDMIIIGNNMEYDPYIFQNAVQHLITCIEQGTLTEDRVMKAYTNVQQLKKKLP